MAFDTYFLRGVDQIQERILKSRVSEEGPLSMAIYLGVRRNSNRNRSISFSDINSDYLSQSPRIVPMPVPWNSKNPDFSVREETYPAREGMNEASRCIHCGMCDDCDNCRLFCPDLCIEWDGRRQIQFDYCKGCGICVTECPRGVITFGETVS
jgi:Pyruvate/2-oxoacid:ferredoxin oxidoreductase delta subunit